MTRYWKAEDGQVADFADDYEFMHPEDWTEVQVVPLDATVIEASELPEVVNDPDDDSSLQAGGAWYAARTADGHHVVALAHLAMEQHQARKHPPVDEAQVKALADDLSRYEATEAAASFKNAARYLIARGWTKREEAAS
ncbi:hypothetical protein GCM10025864_39140 [Luteimicrobium album]|uniref:Uncharacterized protein n=1 Tax=Luteimicrobium album TaxID=1054550 RepID=A0ABQ6I5U9_9MICO|nr:hypothetical protein [Luteimicrobium album]GMA26155.1 hypothetical protein GCM10025864_39140 [Luteimicrobium album]